MEANIIDIQRYRHHSELSRVTVAAAAAISPGEHAASDWLCPPFAPSSEHWTGPVTLPCYTDASASLDRRFGLDQNAGLLRPCNSRVNSSHVPGAVADCSCLQRLIPVPWAFVVPGFLPFSWVEGDQTFSRHIGGLTRDAFFARFKVRDLRGPQRTFDTVLAAVAEDLPPSPKKFISSFF